MLVQTLKSGFRCFGLSLEKKLQLSRTLSAQGTHWHSKKLHTRRIASRGRVV